MSSIPGLGRSPGRGKGNPLQDSCLENPMDSSKGCKESDTTEPLTRAHSLYVVEPGSFQGVELRERLQ